MHFLHPIGSVPMKTLLIALLLGYASTCAAGLGDSPARFGKHVAAARTTAVSAGPASYTDLEKTLDSGTSVHEYLDLNGTVFAVSWSGPFLPDLKEMLGAHFDTMVAAQRQRRGGSSPIVVTRDDVVIISGGHVGAFEGKAWIPAKLPAGFKPADLH